MDERNTKNQTPNPFEEKPKPKKPFNKKIVLNKKAISAIYLGIAFCMVTVLTISLVSTNNKVKNSIDDLDDLSISVPDISITVPDISKPDKPNDKPTNQETPGVNAEVVPPVEDVKPTINFVSPVEGEIVKGYYTDSLVFSETMQDFRTHSGVDIAASIGDNVLAYSNGTVSKVENDPFMGTTVEITHAGGVVSVYKNLGSNLWVEAGIEVKAGDKIGTVGDSAILEIADKPHLHFELWMNGSCINAETELKGLIQ